ncbi:MAG: 30S ribosomal protein S17 [Patescibacteria group bacterium]
MRTLKGIVISHKMQKTAVVRVGMLKQHPRYEKYYRSSKKFKAHDENDEYRVGDTVRIQETRPLSKEKRWEIIGLIKRAETEMIGEEIKTENEK